VHGRRKKKVGGYENAYLFLVGISKNSNLPASLNTPLRYADKDVRDVRDVMLEKNPRFSEDRTEILINQAATYDNINKKLDEMLRKTKKNDLLVFYYSGHSVRKPVQESKKGQRVHDLYLLNYDAVSTEFSKHNAVRYVPPVKFHTLYAKIADAAVENVFIVLDTCYAGTVSEDEFHSTVFDRAGFLDMTEMFSGKEKRIFSIASSAPHELSMEHEDLGNSVLTSKFLDAVDGSANYNHDDDISVSEIFAYVKKKVAKATDGKQHPTQYASRNADFILRRLR
jgi:uncharacterized caspase-like protein